MKRLIALSVCAIVLLPSSYSFGWPKVKKPHFVQQVQDEGEKAFDGVKRPVKGHCRITVYNKSDDIITVTASIGKERVQIKPFESGAIPKANIGDHVEVYVDGGVSAKEVWRSNGVIVENRINLEYNGRDLKRS